MAFVGLWPDTHWVIEIEDYILCGHRTRVSGTRPSRTSPSPRDVCFQTRFSPPYPCYDMASAVGQIYSGGARARSLCSICRRERWKGESGAFLSIVSILMMVVVASVTSLISSPPLLNSRTWNNAPPLPQSLLRCPNWWK